jgi:hypothetical protein
MQPIASATVALTAATGNAGAPKVPSTPSTFDLVFPIGYGLSRVPVAASGNVSLGPDDKVLAIDGSAGNVTNAGHGRVIVGGLTSVGNIVSTGDIELLPHGVVATSAQSTGTVRVGRGDTVATVAQHAVLTPLARRTVQIPALTGAPKSFVSPRGSSTLAPGLYDDVSITRDAKVTISAGNYVIKRFLLASRAQLVLDTSVGTVNVFVEETASWDGDVTGDGTRFVFAYLGSQPFSFGGGSFTGTALVPHADLTLGREPDEDGDPSTTTYSGNFYAEGVWVAPNVIVQEIATPLLAASVSVSNTTPCVGEGTEVTVDASDAGPGATTRINGMPGSHQFVQFAGAPGPRLVVATVVTPDGRADSTTVPITVQRCTPAAGDLAPVALHFWPTPNQVNEVEFMVHDFDAHGVEVLPTTAATYAWSFGDGQTAMTTSPLVSHDYTAAVNPMLPFNYFTASVSVTTSAGSTSTQKVVPIWSVYAANRAKGVVQPHVTIVPSGDGLVLTLTNYETTPLSLTSARVDLLPCDPALDPIPQAASPLSVTVPASATSAVTIPQPAAFPSDICAVGAHLMGTASAGTVYADAYTRVRENPLTKQAVVDPNSIAIHWRSDKRLISKVAAGL